MIITLWDKFFKGFMLTLEGVTRALIQVLIVPCTLEGIYELHKVEEIKN